MMPGVVTCNICGEEFVFETEDELQLKTVTHARALHPDVVEVLRKTRRQLYMPILRPWEN